MNREERNCIINMIERDIREYKQRLKEYKEGIDCDFFDSESAIYYEREKILQLEQELEYYRELYLYR